MDELKQRAESIATSEEFNIQPLGWLFGKRFRKLDELLPGGEASSAYKDLRREDLGRFKMMLLLQGSNDLALHLC